jgi:hypothetical protein
MKFFLCSSGFGFLGRADLWRDLTVLPGADPVLTLGVGSRRSARTDLGRISPALRYRSRRRSLTRTLQQLPGMETPQFRTRQYRDLERARPVGSPSVLVGNWTRFESRSGNRGRQAERNESHPKAQAWLRQRGFAPSQNTWPQSVCNGKTAILK